MKKRVTVFTFALSALLMGVALWPYAPPFEALTAERATVKVKPPGPVVQEAVFRTASGAEVSCKRGKSGRCPIGQLVSMEARQAQLTVWHDGVHVFQIADQEQILYPYEAVYDGRAFLFVLAALLALLGLRRMVIHIGWANQYDGESKSIQRD